MVTELLLIVGGAALGGVLIGALLGSFVSGRRMRARVEEIGDEVVRMHKVAQEKLSGDDPDLKTLLRNLNTAIEQTYRAVDALEDQAQLTKRKSEGGKQVIASTRHIVSMIEDIGGKAPEIRTPAAQATPVFETEGNKKTPQLR